MENSKNNNVKTNSVKTNIITEEEYKKLNEEEKKAYIPYNPSYSDKATMYMVKQANAQMELLNQYGPAFEQTFIMPKEIPTENIEKMVSTVENLVRLLDPITALESVPIIGTLVKPLVKFINMLLQVIGMIFYLLFMIGQGKEMFMDKPYESFKKIDWEGIEKKKKELDELENNGDVDVDVNTSGMTQSAKNMYKNNINALKNCVESTKATLKTMDAGARVQKVLVEEVYAVYTWKGFSSRCLKAFKNLGIDFSPLDTPTEEDIERFNKMFPDPSQKCDEMVKNINNTIQEKYYIKEEKK